MPGQRTRGESQELLTKWSKRNRQYREELSKSAKAVLESHTGGKIPAGVTVKAVEETPNTIYVVVSYVAKAGDELRDGDLEAVSGGVAPEEPQAPKSTLGPRGRR